MRLLSWSGQGLTNQFKPAVPAWPGWETSYIDLKKAKINQPDKAFFPSRGFT